MESSPDLLIGSFSDRGPWVVDPEALVWRHGLAVSAVLASKFAAVSAVVGYLAGSFGPSCRRVHLG